MRCTIGLRPKCSGRYGSGPARTTTKSWAVCSRIPVNHIRYAPLLVFMPFFKGSYASAQRLTQERDATLVALALTLFHRRHAAWPERLEELVPDLLPDSSGRSFHRRADSLSRWSMGGHWFIPSGQTKRTTAASRPDVPEGDRAGIYGSCIHPGHGPAKSDIGWDWILWRPQDESSEPGAE